VLKRALDVLVTAPALAAAAPLMALIALSIKLESPGPAIYSQWRLGRECRPFRFHKFRTMYADWPSRFPELAHRAAFAFDPRALDRVYLQLRDDPRVTPFGRFLRRTSLDELPNLWHVLRGEMSLVGPRPEVPEMLPYYETREKFSVKPGLTCWAQILGRGELSFQETLALDLRYVREHSLEVDRRILVGTVGAIAGGRGAF
jgi:lipopolysaccharide/colanic/teichoic acid biosynthesis glycosyltransferase